MTASGAVHLDCRQQQCSATVFCKAAAALSILFNLCLQFPWVQPVPTPLQIWQMKSSMWSQQLVSLGDSTPDCVFSPLLHRYAARWVAVAVAPIMNSLLHLNTEYFHYISFIGIMRAGGKLTAGLCNSMVSTALFSTGLCLGACLSVWSSCVGLDTGVQVKWLLALMESPHLPDVYISSAYAYAHGPHISSRHTKECGGISKNSISVITERIITVTMLTSKTYACKVTKNYRSAIMSCWIPTEGPWSKTKVI